MSCSIPVVSALNSSADRVGPMHVASGRKERRRNVFQSQLGGRLEWRVFVIAAGIETGHVHGRRLDVVRTEVTALTVAVGISAKVSQRNRAGPTSTSVHKASWITGRIQLVSAIDAHHHLANLCVLSVLRVLRQGLGIQDEDRQKEQTDQCHLQ